MSAYCRYIDTKQWETLREILTEDVNVVFENTDGESIVTFKNPSDLIDSCKQAITQAVTIHHLHNPEFITINDHQAQVIWAMEDRWYMNENSNTEFSYFHGYGHYHVKFQRQSDRWLISEFILSRLKIDQK